MISLFQMWLHGCLFSEVLRLPQPSEGNVPFILVTANILKIIRTKFLSFMACFPSNMWNFYSNNFDSNNHLRKCAVLSCWWDDTELVSLFRSLWFIRLNSRKSGSFVFTDSSCPLLRLDPYLISHSSDSHLFPVGSSFVSIIECLLPLLSPFFLPHFGIHSCDLQWNHSDLKALVFSMLTTRSILDNYEVKEKQLCHYTGLSMCHIMHLIH